MDADLVALLGGDPGNPVQSLADAFRRRRALGALGMATGDPAMANVGKELTGEAQHGVQTAVQAQHLGIQQQQMMDLLRHRRVEEDQGDRRLGLRSDQIDLMNKGLALKGVRYNPNSGEFENVTPLAKTPRRSLLPASTGAAAPPMAPPAAPPPGAAPAGPMAPPVAPLGKWQDKALKDLGNDFNPSSGRSGEFGKNQQRVNAAKRVMALAVDENGNARDLNPQQMPELAQSVAALIGGSSAAQAQIEHLLPKTFSRNVAGIEQYLTAEPHGAGQQAFVQNFVDTAKREALVAQQGIDQVRGQLSMKHQRILRSNPNEANKVLQGFGWELAPDGMPVQKQVQPPPGGGHQLSGKDAQAVQMARERLKRNPQDAAALEVLKLNGVQP